MEFILTAITFNLKEVALMMGIYKKYWGGVFN